MQWATGRVYQNVTLASFDTLIPVESAHASAFGRLHGLTVHDDNGGASVATGLKSGLLV